MDQSIFYFRGNTPTMWGLPYYPFASRACENPFGQRGDGVAPGRVGRDLLLGTPPFRKVKSISFFPFVVGSKKYQVLRNDRKRTRLFLAQTTSCRGWRVPSQFMTPMTLWKSSSRWLWFCPTTKVALLERIFDINTLDLLSNSIVQNQNCGKKKSQNIEKKHFWSLNQSLFNIL